MFSSTHHDDHRTHRNVVTTVRCVHGVGVGPESFAAVRMALQASGFEVSTPRRPAGVPLEEQLFAVSSGCEQPDASPPVWVGVSGGATLGVAAVEHSSVTLSGAVLHEPLVGSLTDELRRGLAQRAAVVAGERPAEAATRFVRDLIGSDVWSALDPAARDAVASRAADVLTDAAAFVDLDVDLERLRAAESPVLLTVGERSPKARHDAARRVADVLGWQVRIIPGCSHLAQVEAPDELAAVVAEFAATVAVPPSDVVPPPEVTKR